MYSTCIFCRSDLGANEAIEHFPVGRRLAFDAAKGRLWVVCRKCERWNLTPLEERWEAIEECERAFRGTKLRVSTEHIGLARLKEGAELVRVGAPQRPEFAAWRYGDQFGKRRKRQIALTSAAVAGTALLWPLPAVGASLAATALIAHSAVNIIATVLLQNKIVARIKGLDEEWILVRRRHLEEAILLRGDRDYPWRLQLEHSYGPSPVKRWWQYDDKTAVTVVDGEEGLRMVGQILPVLNSGGASKRQLKEVITLVEEHRDTDAFFRAAARTAARPSWIHDSGKLGMLSQLPREVLLALEMVSHEESERRAMEGELQILEEAWREADEIAAIADDMFLPEDVSKRLAEMKGH